MQVLITSVRGARMCSSAHPLYLCNNDTNPSSVQQIARTRLKARSNNVQVFQPTAAIYIYTSVASIQSKYVLHRIHTNLIRYGIFPPSCILFPTVCWTSSSLHFLCRSSPATLPPSRDHSQADEAGRGSTATVCARAGWRRWPWRGWLHCRSPAPLGVQSDPPPWTSFPANDDMWTICKNAASMNLIIDRWIHFEGGGFTL